METSPRPMDSWIPLLGLSLILIAGVGAHPRILKADRIPAVHVVLLAATVAAGIIAILARRLRPKLVCRVAYSALAVYGAYLAFDVLRYLLFSQTLLLLGNAGYILQILCTPPLWGLALSRREDATQERTQRYGRMAAGLIQLSFVFLFVSEVQSFRYFSGGLASGAVLPALQHLMEAASRVLLLWSSILCMRTTADPLRIQEWAGRIHRLVFASVGAGFFAYALNIAIYSGLADDGSERFSLPWVWRGLLVTALTLLAAFTMPPCFRSAPAGDDSPSRPTSLPSHGR